MSKKKKKAEIKIKWKVGMAKITAHMEAKGLQNNLKETPVVWHAGG